MRQQQGGSDNSLDFLWLMVFIIGIILGIWYFGKNQILFGVIKVKYFELIAIGFCYKLVAGLASFLHIHLSNDGILTWLAYMRSPELQYNVPVALHLSLFVGQILRYVFIPILLFLMVKVYFANAKARFNTVYQMSTLREKECDDYPHLNAIVKSDLVEVDLDELPWAMSMTPMRFCKHYNLLEEYEKDREPAVRLLRDRAHQIFVTQLGPLWTTIDKQPMYIQALFAVFAARANEDSEGGRVLLRQMAASSKGAIDFSGARTLLRKHYNTKLVARCLGMHAYTRTVMAGMLNLARTDGVLACSEFLWLKRVDRLLWYTLNNMGRQTAYPEIAGVFAHYLVESKLKAALRAPYVSMAVDGMELALSEVKYDPEIKQ